jgi:hypothetical protein
MFRKMVVVLGMAAVVGLVGLLTVGTVLAQRSGPNATTPQQGVMGGGVCGGQGVCVADEAVAKLLGLTSEQLAAERAAGKTLAQIAKEKGVTDQQLTDSILAERQADIDQALKDGQITQAQADWMLARAKAMIPFQISNSLGPRGAGAGMQRGMRGNGGVCPRVTSSQAAQ